MKDSNNGIYIYKLDKDSTKLWNVLDVGAVSKSCNLCSLQQIFLVISTTVGWEEMFIFSLLGPFTLWLVCTQADSKGYGQSLGSKV